IRDPVIITGAGPGTSIIDANGIDRVFDVFANGTTSISGLTIRNGNSGSASGGGIANGGIGTDVATLNLSNVVVTQNTATVHGGGIVNFDNLSLVDTTVSNNVCSGSCSGAGIFTNGISTTLNRVTLSGNTAGGGGGATASDSDVSLTNVTMFGNSAASGAAMMHNA